MQATYVLEYEYTYMVGYKSTSLYAGGYISVLIYLVGYKYS